MDENIPTNSSFREYFASILRDAGFDVQIYLLEKDSDPIVLAENAYYVIAFQVFDLWSDLTDSVGRIEMDFSALISQHTDTPKVWDAYMILVCRSNIHGKQEFNELSDMLYNTRYTRKIVRYGFEDSISKLSEVARPFVSLREARSSAKGRDPLRLLEAKMIESGLDSKDRDTLHRLITIFRDRGNLDGN